MAFSVLVSIYAYRVYSFLKVHVYHLTYSINGSLSLPLSCFLSSSSSPSSSSSLSHSLSHFLTDWLIDSRTHPSTHPPSYHWLIQSITSHWLTSTYGKSYRAFFVCFCLFVVSAMERCICTLENSLMRSPLWSLLRRVLNLLSMNQCHALSLCCKYNSVLPPPPQTSLNYLRPTPHISDQPPTYQTNPPHIRPIPHISDQSPTYQTNPPHIRPTPHISDQPPTYQTSPPFSKRWGRGLWERGVRLVFCHQKLQLKHKTVQILTKVSWKGTYGRGHMRGCV